MSCAVNPAQSGSGRLKGTMFCDDCLRLHQILESLWKSEQQGKSVTADDRA
jgi:hypothetical protein